MIQPQTAPKVSFDALKKGKFVELLKSQHEKVKEEDKVSPPVEEALAAVIDGFFEEPRTAGELERITKLYPRIGNVEKQLVPKLDTELFNAIDPQVRGLDVGLQNMQKGLVAAISAISAVGSLLISRGETD